MPYETTIGHERVKMTQVARNKYCPSCGKILPIERFHRDAGRPDGRNGHCGACRSAQNRARYAARKAVAR